MNIGLYGFGEINRLVAKEALKRGWNIAGAVDIRKDLVGRDIGEILGLGSEIGVRVSNDPMALIDSDIVVHATGSFLDETYPQIAAAIEMGLDVISTCETLAYPYYRYPVLARRIDKLAQNHGVTVLGTGINPGFLLDTLPVILASTLPRITSITAVRRVDASKRRGSFKGKIGVGMEPNVFKRLLSEGAYTGHVGYAESVLLIADSLGVHLDRVAEGQEPVIASETIEENGVLVRKGMVSGIRGYGEGWLKGKRIIRVEFEASVGAEEYEEIKAEGPETSVQWRSKGTNGDLGTVAVLLNLAGTVENMEPGLKLMSDLIPFKPILKPD